MNPSPAPNTGSSVSVGSESSEISEDETGIGITAAQSQFMDEQTQYFEQVKQFLVSQQMTLKQNLELLQNKMSKESKSPPTCVQEPVLKSLELNSLENELGKREDTDPKKPNDDKHPMCPICGTEFETNSLTTLEDHVASHWNSDLLEVSEEPS